MELGGACGQTDLKFASIPWGHRLSAKYASKAAAGMTSAADHALASPCDPEHSWMV